MNNIIICGFLVQEPEVRETKDGKHICTFNMAVKRNQEKTDFFKVVSFGEKAEICNKWLKKGSKCIIVGTMQNEQYETKEGTKRDSWQVALREIEFIAKLRKNKEDGEEEDDLIPVKQQAQLDIFGNCANLPF